MTRKHALLILSIAFALLLFAAVRIDIVKSSYAIHALEKQERDTRDEISRITARTNTARSPQRLEQLARKVLGMRPAIASEKVILPPAGK